MRRHVINICIIRSDTSQENVGLETEERELCDRPQWRLYSRNQRSDVNCFDNLHIMEPIEKFHPYVY